MRCDCGRQPGRQQPQVLEQEHNRREAAQRNGALHPPSAVESMDGLSELTQQLIGEIHHSAGSHCPWRDAHAIGNHPRRCDRSRSLAPHGDGAERVRASQEARRSGQRGVGGAEETQDSGEATESALELVS